ncbi:MAG: F0F1 ATP synthase subunit A [Candidatus Wildermuthbacteria bacterium]|nr:F0F1 ATP synthase subunit A [Candidatus Wildermuthbacteria bacterium]
METHIALKPEIIDTLVGVPISNSLVLSVLAGLFLVAVGFLGVRVLRAVPSKIQNAVELVIESILNFMAGVLGSESNAKKFFPLVATLFLFILFNNWIGVLPGTGSVEFRGEPLFRAANSDLNTTLALALISVIAIQFYGIQKLGLLRHLSKFFVFTKGPIQFFVGILELIAEFAKILSFSFRLFGNVFAGEVLLLIVMGLAPFLAPVPFFGLELFVGFIQALVFAMLTLIFLKIATEEVSH